ncbi:MAG: ankyrin repeat domain-containing protein [Gammaproteobacteria bacterium]|nr:ankyrin repeat domain-containing protein [Gammaproteobacteria bacterium]
MPKFIRALDNGNIEEMKSMLKEDPKIIDTKDTDGQTALFFAANRPDGRNDLKFIPESMVKFLIENGADVNAVDQNGDTALIKAADHGNAPVVKMLLADARTMVDAINARGMTALMKAAFYGHAPVVKMLLTYGAKTMAKSDEMEKIFQNAANDKAHAWGPVISNANVNSQKSTGSNPQVKLPSGGRKKHTHKHKKHHK